MAMVLYTGFEPSVVRTRQLILERVGHTVVPVLDESVLPTACKQNQFAVAVMGQAISPVNKQRISSRIMSGAKVCRRCRFMA